MPFNHKARSCVRTLNSGTQILCTVGAVLQRSLAIRAGPRLARQARMSAPKTCVYVLRSQSDPSRYYTGVSSNWQARRDAHNDGACHHTAKYGPWKVDVLIQFADERRAAAFERYLKSGSGCAFAKRHFRV